MVPEPFGQYTLIDRLGYGGMAEVFLAQATTVSGFEKLLAIKRLLPHCVEDTHTVDLLTDEARITVQLSHPNIVQVFDFGCVDDAYFMAMEYVDGVDLKTLVEIDEECSEALPLDVALRIVIGILDGLHYAHQRADRSGQPLGIIHRDVTPHNVLISRHGQVKLTDFGVARAHISSHVSMVGDIRGKFSYMPPEQACGGEIDHRVDVFASGAILYELVSGRQPFRSSTTGEQMRLLSKPIAPPSQVAPGLPQRLDEVILKALDKDPSKRFLHAKAFSDALREQMERTYGQRAVQSVHKLADRVETCLKKRGDAKTARGDVMLRGDFQLGPGASLIIGREARKAANHGAQRTVFFDDDDAMAPLPSAQNRLKAARKPRQDTAETRTKAFNPLRPAREDTTDQIATPESEPDDDSVLYASDTLISQAPHAKDDTSRTATSSADNDAPATALLSARKAKQAHTGPPHPSSASDTAKYKSLGEESGAELTLVDNTLDVTEQTSRADTLRQRPSRQEAATPIVMTPRKVLETPTNTAATFVRDISPSEGPPPASNRDRASPASGASGDKPRPRSQMGSGRPLLVSPVEEEVENEYEDLLAEAYEQTLERAETIRLPTSVPSPSPKPASVPSPGPKSTTPPRTEAAAPPVQLHQTKASGQQELDTNVGRKSLESTGSQRYQRWLWVAAAVAVTGGIIVALWLVTLNG